MASECASLSTEFLLGLNWRPLYFEHPLPHGRVCQVCGILSKETVQLPCFHTLCNVCYEGSVDLGCVCPLDREVFSQEGVDKLSLRPEHVLKLRVFCWNSVHGCNFVGSALELLHHFAKDCAFHTVTCLACHKNVTRLGLVQHYVNGCASSAEPTQPDVTYWGQLHQELGKISAALKLSISELEDGYYRLQTSFNTVADDVKIALSEGKQGIKGASALLRELQRTQSDVNSQGCQLLEYLKKAGVEIKQFIAGRDDSGLHAGANTGVTDGLQPARSEHGSSVKREVIFDANMSTDMQRDAMDAATQALEKSNVAEEIAQCINEAFRKKYKPRWQCIVGESFSSCVYAKENHFIHFKLGRFSILLFK